MNKTTKIALSIIILVAIVAAAVYALSDKDDMSYEGQTETMTAATTTEMATYTLADVAAHSTPNDCWIAVNGNVLNVTDFIAKGLHPNDKIENGCGKDATSMFEAVGKHDGGKAQAALKQYQIGTLR